MRIEVIRGEFGCPPEGFEHFPLQGVAGEDLVIEELFAELVEELAESEVIVRRLRFQFDGPQVKGEGGFALALLGEMGADLLFDDGDFRVDIVCLQEGGKGGFFVVDPAEEFAVEDERFDVFGVIFEVSAIGLGQAVDVPLQIIRAVEVGVFGEIFIDIFLAEGDIAQLLRGEIEIWLCCGGA